MLDIRKYRIVKNFGGKKFGEFVSYKTIGESMTLLIFLMRTGPRDYSVCIERRLRCTVSAWFQ